jgi:serine/threonine protein kinase
MSHVERNHNVLRNYVLCEKIGKGSFASVYKAEEKVSIYII